MMDAKQLMWDVGCGEPTGDFYVVTPAQLENIIAKVHANALAQQGEQPDQRLVNLLCRIHRDGGHYIAKHGIDKAVIDADVRVAQLNALTDTAAPAPQPAQEQEQVGINGLTEAETSATMSVLGLSEPAQGNAELIARSTKVAAELDDFNSSLDRKATKCIRELLTALQSAQPAVANIQTKIVKDISAHEGGKQQLPPLPTTEPDARGCAYCNHPLFLGSKCKNCGKEVK